MRRTVDALLVVVGIAAVPATSVATRTDRAAGAQITVKPASGSPTTLFTVSFRTPIRTGRVGVIVRREELIIDGPSRQAGCVSGVSRAMPSAAAHARVSTTLDPIQLGGRWCGGGYRGQINEIRGPACGAGRLCPKLVSVLRTLGRFTFVVQSSSKDAAPPAFAGLQRAFACTPGPQRPGETTPFALSWTAATDNVTPSSEIVYDVFMSTTAGGEDFARPNWTTAPGATQFTTPGLASHGVFYFVVRARDQAGNEDHNRVERQGIDPCL